MKSDGPIDFDPVCGLQGVQLLPPELWVHIFHRVPWHSRRPVTLVCQTFRWLAQPLLFENLEIKVTKETRDTLADRLKFISSPHISPAVKVCRMYSPTLAFAVEPEFKEVGLNALSRFPNLVSLRLDGFTVTTSLLDTIASFQHLSELEFLQCIPGIDDAISPKHSIPLRYLKSGGMPIKNDTLDATSAALVHPMHTHVLVLGHRPYRFLRRLLDTGSTLSLRSLTIRPGIAASPEFSGIIDICPALEELRFPVERSFTYNASPTTYPFNEPSKDALSRLRVFQGPWYMVEAFTKERPVAHLVIWEFDEGKEDAIQMLTSQVLRYPMESLELYLPNFTSTVVRALAPMTAIRALSLVIENFQAWTDLYSTVEGMDIPPTLEYFACYTKHSAEQKLQPLFPKEKFPRLRYLCDNDEKSYNPATGDIVEEDFIENWQRSALGLYRPLIDCYV